MLQIGITMGCPVGIGPEIILKYFNGFVRRKHFQPVVIGDMNVIRQCAKLLAIDISCFQWDTNAPYPVEGIPVFPVTSLDPKTLQWGRPDGHTGRAMADYIIKGVSLLQAGVLDGITTCPISKKALHEAGYAFPGHTEMLAHLTGNRTPVMMMAGNRLRITLVTIHCPLKEVPSMLSKASVLDLIRITCRALVLDFSIKQPRIAVAGLNPHAGEQGLFGDEEIEHILPAIEDARRDGIDAQGPFPPDTVFVQAAAGKYDAVVCMYHDQGLIPFKLMHFNDGVNVTLGLPIVRTSVDHGTAYDIAGTGVASPDSLAAAVELAATIARNRGENIAKLHSIQGIC